MTDKFDLHTHSYYSDGTCTPAELVRAAFATGCRLIALTDHDCMDGVDEAVRTGAAIGVQVLAGVEFDCAWTRELHILGLGLDVNNAALQDTLLRVRERREERNERIFRQLYHAGYDIKSSVSNSSGILTRLHIALALRNGGYATSVRDAFDRFLGHGCIGHVDGYRERCIPPAEAIHVIHDAGGTAIWAHPMKMPDHTRTMIQMLKKDGLDGIEARHPSASESEVAELFRLAEDCDLMATCGSDFHGAHVPGIVPGCTWRNCAQLDDTYHHFR